jgi:hypothetical protein
MNRPPILMHVKIQNEEHTVGLWLPLFLLIIIALAVLIILSPLILIAVIVFWPSGWGEWALKVLWAAIVSCCSMRGLEVNVQNGDKHVYVSVV